MQNFINYIAYFIGFVAVLWFAASQGYSPKKIRNRMIVLQRSKQKETIRKLLEKRIFRKYHFLLSSSVRFYQQEFFMNILTTQLGLLLFTLVMIFMFTGDIFFGLGVSILLCIVLPVSLLFMIHKRKQYNIQDYLDEAIVILLQEYEKNGTNMLYSIKSVSEILDGPLAVTFSKLFARMHSTKEDKILATETFAFQLGYSRGKLLATTILRAIIDRDNVKIILQDLTLHIAEFQKKFSDAKSDATETVLAGYFTIIALISLIMFNVFYFFKGDMASDKNAFYYSFFHPESFKWLVITSIVSLFNIALVVVLKRPKKGI
ncbi:hypothetical protein [Gottfriedia solisilvae]|uniref:hypothetical protein n=1 Tax=Gottfriedia solisilvae TaxID=1516104 RepID=UPI003D2EB03F